jgi:myosin-5
LFRTVSAVLNLSRVRFHESEESCCIDRDSEFPENVAQMLALSLDQLEKILCFKMTIDPSTKKKIYSKLNKNAAEFNRETFAKIIYDKLFDWLVKKVNVEIKKPPLESQEQTGIINILDIFGFEIFETNSFEQLCINFTNEKLQMHFNEHMITMEQKEYTMEGVDWADVNFVGNHDTIALVEKRPNCIFGYLDELGTFGNATDQKFLEKVQTAFKSHEKFSIGAKTKRNLFGIIHFAGKVEYNVTGFLEKNKNSKNKEMDEIMAGSQNEFVSIIFQENKRASTNEKNKSVSGQFLEQLDSLVHSLEQSNSLYIRCIKPNKVMKYQVFDAELVVTQLKCAGMLEAIRIRSCGFPVRRSYEAFCKHYKNVFKFCSIEIKDHRVAVEKFINSPGMKDILKRVPKGLQLGKSKVFMKEQVKTELDQLYERSLTVPLKLLQRWFKKKVMKLRLERRFRSKMQIQYISRAFAKRRMGRDFLAFSVAWKAKLARNATKIQNCVRRKIFKMRVTLMAKQARESRSQFGDRRTLTAPESEEEGLINDLLEKKKKIKENFSKVIENSRQNNNMDWDELEGVSSQSQMRGSLQDVTLNPKYIEMALENQSLKRELDKLKSSGFSVGHSAQTEMERLRRKIKNMEEQNREKDRKDREKDIELERLRAESTRKTKIIDKLKQDIENIKYDEELYNQISTVNDIIKEKDGRISELTDK